MCSDVLRCSQMFSDDHRCFWIFSRYSVDVLSMFSRYSLDVFRMFAGFFQDVFRMLRWVLSAWWNMMIISNERYKGTRWTPTIWWSQLFNDPQLFDDPQPFDDPQLFDDQLEAWTLIIQKVYGDTSISEGLVFIGLRVKSQEFLTWSRWPHLFFWQKNIYPLSTKCCRPWYEKREIFPSQRGEKREYGSQQQYLKSWSTRKWNTEFKWQKNGRSWDGQY